MNEMCLEADDLRSLDVDLGLGPLVDAIASKMSYDNGYSVCLLMLAVGEIGSPNSIQIFRWSGVF